MVSTRIKNASQPSCNSNERRSCIKEMSFIILFLCVCVNVFPVLPSPLFSPLPLCLLDLLDPLLCPLSPPSDSCGSVIGWFPWGAGLGCYRPAFLAGGAVSAVSFGNRRWKRGGCASLKSSFRRCISSILLNVQSRRIHRSAEGLCNLSSFKTKRKKKEKRTD